MNFTNTTHAFYKRKLPTNAMNNPPVHMHGQSGHTLPIIIGRRNKKACDVNIFSWVIKKFAAPNEA